MLFNSIEFAIFLPIVFILYWFIFNKNLKAQNIFLLVVSYIFYGWWDWRFLSLIVFSSLVDYLVGLNLGSETNLKKRRLLLAFSIIVNLGFLGFFKYYNFFLENFIESFRFFGHELNITSLKIILPVGISFYTFQTMSYTIDVYRNKLKPTNNIIDFFTYVSFFPQLVAGPIERATHLLPQFEKKREFSYAQGADGLRLILWGLFKKIVIADTCAKQANLIFANPETMAGTTLILGAIFFAFQIYGDFSGYSDIAIGTARLFGFSLMTNFRTPYFSRDMAEFWRRWHISLSTWFRDYLYIPLGGSKVNKSRVIRNTLIIFLVSGFWHGANWTFLIWGLLNALYFIPLLITNYNRKNLDNVAEGKWLPGLKDVFNIGLTFSLTCFAWIFFRAENVTHAFSYISHIFSNATTHPGQFLLYLKSSFIALFLVFITIEWVNRNKPHALYLNDYKIPRTVKWGFYNFLIIAIFVWGGEQQSFIYFKY
jgi:D-alanyl-lipoteichoic acid acyltransferase DltB (MBOAT superfamily)